MGRLLIYGYGNPGRGDDGLGPALVQAFEQLEPVLATVDSNYQLTVEDAAELAEHDVVIFADAAVSGLEPFGFERVEPGGGVGFSSHSVSPGSLVMLTHELFGKKVEAYALGVRGYEFGELREKLSPRAEANLGSALAFLTNAVREQKFGDYLHRYGKTSGRAADQAGA
jgi:hydrogenase maturation protease